MTTATKHTLFAHQNLSMTPDELVAASLRGLLALPFFLSINSSRSGTVGGNAIYSKGVEALPMHSNILRTIPGNGKHVLGWSGLRVIFPYTCMWNTTARDPYTTNNKDPMAYILVRR